MSSPRSSAYQLRPILPSRCRGLVAPCMPFARRTLGARFAPWSHARAVPVSLRQEILEGKQLQWTFKHVPSAIGASEVPHSRHPLSLLLAFALVPDAVDARAAVGGGGCGTPAARRQGHDHQYPRQPGAYLSVGRENAGLHAAVRFLPSGRSRRSFPLSKVWRRA